MTTREQAAASTAFTFAGIRHGVRDGALISLSIVPWGLAFGLLAQQSLSLTQSTVMSGYVFSATAQFVALDMWRHPLALGALLFAVAAINARYLLQGVTLAPWLNTLPPLPRFATLFLLSDASWAMSLQRFERGDDDAGYLFGSSLAIYSGWVISTVAGHAVPLSTAGMESLGLDFAISAALIGLAGGRWTGTSDLLPWIVAALSALAAYALFGGYWYMLVGGISGAAAGMLSEKASA